MQDKRITSWCMVTVFLVSCVSVAGCTVTDDDDEDWGVAGDLSLDGDLPPEATAKWIQVVPKEKKIPLGHEIQFTYILDGELAGTDPEVEWLVDEVLGGSVESGTITEDGLYTAPDSLPATGKVVVRVQLVEEPDLLDDAIVTFFDPDDTWILVDPSPGAVAVRSRVTFTASVNTGLTSNSIEWYVNDIKGGTKAAGFIEPDELDMALYQAPTSLELAPFEVCVTAVSAEISSLKGTSCFPLVEVAPDPPDVFGDQPGQSFEAKVEARYSNGSEEDITSLPTTVMTFTNPLVARAGDVGEIVLEEGVGVVDVLVQDTRWSPPADALIKVRNAPDYGFMANQETWDEVVWGIRKPFQLFLVADRGPAKGQKQDVVLSQSVSAESLDENGVVSTDGVLPAQPALLTAWLDMKAGLLVTGAKPGTARFRFTESATGKTVEIEVKLHELEIDMPALGSWLKGEISGIPDLCTTDTDPCPEGTYPYSTITPVDQGRLNGYLRMPVHIRDAAGVLTSEEVFQMLDGLSLILEDDSKQGRFIESRAPVSPNCWGLFQNKQYTPGWSQEKAVLPIRHYEDNLYCGELVYASADYAPATPGPRTIKATIEGLSLIDGIEAPSASLEVRGRLPRVNPYLMNSLGTADDCNAYAEICQHGFGPALFQHAGALNDPHDDFWGVPVALRVKRPDGTFLPDDDVVAIPASDNTNDKFEVLFREEGMYEVWYESVDHPGVPMGQVMSFSVAEPRADKGPEIGGTLGMFELVESSTLEELYSGAGTFTIRLKDGFGNAVVALPVSNDLCPGRDEKDQGGLRILFKEGNNGPESMPDSLVLYVGSNHDPDKGKVRVYLVEGQVVKGGGSWYVWRPEAGKTDIVIGTEVLRPMSPTSYVLFSFRHWYVQDDCSSPTVQYWGIGSSNMVFHPREVSVLPGTLVIPHNPQSDEVVTAVRAGGVAVKRLIDLTGMTPSPDEFAVADNTGVPIEGITVKSVEIADDKASWIVKLGIAKDKIETLVGKRQIRLQSTYLNFSKSLTVIAVDLLANPLFDEAKFLPPLSLNARLADGLPVGMMRAWLHVTGPGGAKALVHLKVESPEDESDFQLVGFGREEQPEYHDGTYETKVTTDETTVMTSRNFENDLAEVTLWGNLTDRMMRHDGKDYKLGDMLPDVVSKEPDSVVVSMMDPVTGDYHPLATTTAFVFEAERLGDLRHGNQLRWEAATEPGHVKDYLTFPEMFALPETPCEPMTTVAPEDPDRDVYVHVDSTFSEDFTGLADMKFLRVDDAVTTADRLRGYQGESPLGRPAFPMATTPDPDWEYFGVELDGVCYDPGVGNDDDPNSQELFQFTLDDGFVVPVNDATGQVPGEGGTSGGVFNVHDGRFTLLTRTPGVDFPGLDCGFQVKGKPVYLGENDFEDVCIDDDSIEVDTWDLVNSSFPKRVFSFAEMRDFKKMIISGYQSRGPNSAFRVTTRPLSSDGTPLVDTDLKATVLVGEWPVFETGNEGIQLTARVDAAAILNVKVSKWAVPVIVAAVTGAIGSWMEGANMIAGASVNMLVAVVFTGAEEFLNFSMGSGGGGVGGAIVSKQAGKLLPRMAKMLKYVFGFGKGVTQTAVRRAVTESALKSASLKGGAFVQDAVGGILASIIVGYITEAQYNLTNVGGAFGFAFDQLWVGFPVPPEELGDDPGMQSYMIADMRAPRRLTGRDPIVKELGMEQVAENDESDLYLKRTIQATRPLTILAQPGVSPTSFDPSVCPGQDIHEPALDFRIHVGGDEPTVIPYVRTSIAAAARNSEEATARVRIDRSGTAVRMHIVDAVLEGD